MQKAFLHVVHSRFTFRTELNTVQGFLNLNFWEKAMRLYKKKKNVIYTVVCLPGVT